MTSDIPRPDSLELHGNVAASWRIWKQEFQIYLRAKELVRKPDDVRVALLLNCVGREARERYNHFTWEEADDMRVYAKVIEQFDEHFQGKKRLVFSRYKFWCREQTEGQELIDYVTALRTLADQCEFTERDNMIRDKLVFSLKNQQLKQRLLEVDNLTLQMTIEKCQAAETTQREIKIMADGVKEEFSVEAVRRQPKRSSRRILKPERDFRQCGNCGTSHPPRACPAWGKECHSCHKKNHFAQFCRSKAKHRLSKQTAALTLQEATPRDHDDSGEEQLDMGAVTCVNSISEETAWWQIVNVAGKSIRFKIDTGAEVNVLPRSAWESFIDRPRLDKSSTVLKTIGGTHLVQIGKAKLTLEANNRTVEEDVFIIKSDVTPLLGLQTALKLALIKRNVEPKATAAIQEVQYEGLKEAHITKKYQDVFDGKIGNYPGLYQIHLTDDAIPKINAPRRIPHHLTDTLKNRLQEMVKNGIIEPVDKPTDWVNSMVVTEKKDGSLRICLDPRELNKYIKREHFTIPTFQEVITQLGKPKYFSIFDQSSAFWQIHLHEDSRDLTTFQTPFGRFRFCRMPFGISSASEVQQKKAIQIFGDISHTFLINDDMLIAAESEEDHDQAVITVLEKARQYGIKFNPSKLQFKRKEVVYHGTKLSNQGIQADEEKVKAIKAMPEPEEKKGVQRFLGMINYLSPFILHKASLTEPLRQLIKEGVPWNWSNSQKDAIRKLKEALTTKTVLRYFDESKPLVIQADASKTGLGACLLQENQPICYASRPLTDTESRYAQIEKELLAILFASKKFHHYIYGVNVTVHTDHKPLVAIQHKDLNKVSLRLQLMLLKLLYYRLDITYKPGREMHIADALSRAYIDSNSKADESGSNLYVHSVMTFYPASSLKIDAYRQATLSDETSRRVKEYTTKGWPRKKNVPVGLIPYYEKRYEIYQENDLLFVGHKLIIPRKEQAFALQRLHAGHQGIEKTKALAREYMYWPGINRDIEETVKACKVCQKYRRLNTKELIKQHCIPLYPWVKIGADIFQFGSKDYLVVVDYYSKFPEIARLRSKTASSVIQAMKTILARQGIPEVVVADNMPFGSGEFRKFAKDWNFQLSTSSPRYPQSNGQAEEYVGILKMLLRKCLEDNTDPNLALLRYRNTPITGMTYSPAQLLYSRRLRDDISMKKTLLKPKVAKLARSQLLSRQIRQASYYNRNAKSRPGFHKGETIRVKIDNRDDWVPAVIEEHLSAPRSYRLTTESGQEIRRNSRMINKTSEMPEALPEDQVGDHQTPTVLSPDQLQSSTSQSSPQPLRRSTRIRRPPQWHRDLMT